MNIYYVYAYLRKKDLTPYYIGMGQKRRAWSNDHCVKIPDESYRIIILETNLTKVGAMAIERRLIRWYGKKVDNTGILRNISNGGDGGCGNIYRRSPSEETKQKISKTLTGRKIGSPSEEHRQKIRESLTGKKRPEFSKEWRDNLSKSGKGRKSHNKGKFWWTDGITHKFSTEAPGPNWSKCRV